MLNKFCFYHALYVCKIWWNSFKLHKGSTDRHEGHYGPFYSFSMSELISYDRIQQVYKLCFFIWFFIHKWSFWFQIYSYYTSFRKNHFFVVFDTFSSNSMTMKIVIHFLSYKVVQENDYNISMRLFLIWSSWFWM